MLARANSIQSHCSTRPSPTVRRYLGDMDVNVGSLVCLSFDLIRFVFQTALSRHSVQKSGFNHPKRILAIHNRNMRSRGLCHWIPIQGVYVLLSTKRPQGHKKSNAQNSTKYTGMHHVHRTSRSPLLPSGLYCVRQKRQTDQTICHCQHQPKDESKNHILDCIFLAHKF